MSPESHVQEVVLPAGQDFSRVPLNWEALSDVGSWTTLTWQRNKPTWIEPTRYSSLHGHPNLASSLILLKSPDWSTTLAVYPVTTLTASNDLVVVDGRIHANVRRTKAGSAEKVWVVSARAQTPEEERLLIQGVVEQARDLVRGHAPSDIHQEVTSDLWDGIGVCTYESLRQSSSRPTKDNLLSLVPSVPIKTFLIDDGWQEIIKHPSTHGEDRFLLSFHPWSGFGASLTEVVEALKDTGIEEVGVWLTLQGYWGGISPDSALIHKYDCQPHRVAYRNQPRGGVGEYKDSGDMMYLPSPDRAAAFWRDWFELLKSWGVGFIKVDNQAGYDSLIGVDAAEAKQAMWKGLLEAVADVWGSLDRVIMCMSHNERMLNGPGGLDFDRPQGRLVYRNSDDFNLNWHETHVDHIRYNVYSTILSSHLSFVPDVDMFASNPPELLPTYHALLRALMPGPTLLSDTPDVETDLQLVEKMTAKDRKGKLKSIKADKPAVLLANRWFWDNIHGEGEGPAIIAGAPCDAARGGLLGVWNGRMAKGGGRAIDTISLRDVEDLLGRSLEHDNEYALWSVGLSNENGNKVELVGRGWSGGMHLELEKNECELVVLAKVWRVGGKKVAVVGMLDRLAPLAGIKVDVEHGQLVIRSQYHAPLSVLLFNKHGGSFGVSVDGQKTEPVSATVSLEPAVQLATLALPDLSISTANHGDWEVTLEV